MATALAASIPPYLDKPTLPPIAWAQNGEIITVILADGRKFSSSVQEINAIMFSQHVETPAAAQPPAKFEEGTQMPKVNSPHPPAKVKGPTPPKPASKGGTKKK